MSPASSPTPFLELCEVSKVYRTGDQELRALDQVSLRVAEGEFVAIVGQSGSGKSTLMNIVGCLDRPSSGAYLVRGRDVSDFNSDELAALRCDTFGFIFQRYNLLATASAEENVEIPAVYAGVPRRERLERARTLLARLGLEGRGGHRPGQLSGGQQQRVSIARALMNDAAVVLADEPTGALDTQSGLDVLDLMEALHREGRTVLLITHNPELAERAERVITLRDGAVVSDEPGRAEKAAPNGRAGHQPLTRAISPLPTPTEVLEAVKMALRSLKANIFRTALTLLGVVIGVAAVVTMLAIGDGSKAQVLESIQSMGTNLIMVMPGAPGMRPTSAVATLTVDDAEALAGVDNVGIVVPNRETQATVRAGNVDYRTSIKGAWPGFTEANDWDLAQGAFFTEDDVDSYAPVVVLGKTVTDNLFPDQDPVGQYILVGNVPFEIIGVLEEKGANAFGSDQDDVAVIPLTTGFMRVFGSQYLNNITVYVDDVELVDQTQEAVRQLLLKRHNTEDFQARNTASLLAMATDTQDTLTVLLGSVAAISLLVGGIGVMNIMLVSVTERTREIGIRMATGARMLNILLQFNTEALVVCGVGGLAGVLLGLGTALLVGRFGMNVAFSPFPPLLAFGCSFLTGLVFGYLPARKAARMDPVVALASE